MGLMSDHYGATFEGHSIEVEVRVYRMGSGEYDLIIDNKRVDQIHGCQGTFSLRGELLFEGHPAKQVKVSIKQGFFRTKYTLEVEGTEWPMKKM
jgi:hypothetical protein